MFNFHAQSEGDTERFLAAVHEDANARAAEGLKADTDELENDVLETRIACDVFARSLRDQFKVFHQELRELREMRETYLPPAVVWQEEAAKRAEADENAAANAYKQAHTTHGVHFDISRSRKKAMEAASVAAPQRAGTVDGIVTEAGVRVLPTALTVQGAVRGRAADDGPGSFIEVSADVAYFNSYLIETVEEGPRGTGQHAIYAVDHRTEHSLPPESPAFQARWLPHGRGKGSFWHGIPLCATDPIDGRWTGAFHFVCEMPKYSKVLREIDTQAPHNPIRLVASKDGTVEKLGRPLIFNYGALPRTWLNPAQDYLGMGKGDNDQLDCIEVGLRAMRVGDVRRVKVLGVLVLSRSDADDESNDELNALFGSAASASGGGGGGGGGDSESASSGEMESEFKLVVVDETDRWAGDLDTLQDLEALRPGTLERIRFWFLNKHASTASAGAESTNVMSLTSRKRVSMAPLSTAAALKALADKHAAAEAAAQADAAGVAEAGEFACTSVEAEEPGDEPRQKIRNRASIGDFDHEAAAERADKAVAAAEAATRRASSAAEVLAAAARKADAVAAAGEAAAAAAMEHLPLFGPLREEFNAWGLTTRGEVRHRRQVDALGRAVETALAAQETRVANAALLAAQEAGSNAGVFAQPQAVLALRELRQLLPRPLLEAALALKFWGGLVDLEAAAEKVEQQGAQASTYAQQQQEALEATFAHRLALAAARPGSGFEFGRPTNNSPIAANQRNQPLHGGRVQLRASKLPHVDENQITKGQRLSPNCYYGRAAAAAVLRRAHSGWRAALRAHYPLHPMSMAGRPSLLEAQADLCAEAGAAWVRTTPPAAPPPTPLDVLADTLAGAAGLGESFGAGSNSGDGKPGEKRLGTQAAEAAATAARESLKAVTFSHEEDDQPTKAGEEPPVVWLLWVAPPETLDANAVANDAVFAEAFATRERERLVEEEGVREEVRARLLALAGVRNEADHSRASRARADSLLQAANADCAAAAAEGAQRVSGMNAATEAQDPQRFIASLKATGRSDGSGEGGTFDVGGTSLDSSFDQNPASGTLTRVALGARGDDEPEPVAEWVAFSGAVPVLLTETWGTLGTESFSIYATQDHAAKNSQAARRRSAMAVAEAADRRNGRASISFGAESAGASSSSSSSLMKNKNTSRVSFWHDIPLTIKEAELAGGGVGAAGGPIANPTVKGRFENQSAASVLESYSVGRALAAALAVTSGGAVADAEAADLLVQEPPKCRPDLWRPTGSLCWVCECPLNTRRHLRIATRTLHNPLKQDERFGEMRTFARSLFFNLGALPRTWQDPSYKHPALAGADGAPFTVGDNCPVAAVEVGSRAVPVGETRSVKVLGDLPVLDQVKAATGKAGGSGTEAILEWILIAIDDTDLWARELQCTEDLDALAPGSLESIRGLIHDHHVASHASADLAGAPYCVIGPSVGAEFAIGVVRTAYYCYKRLLQMNWDAAKQSEEDESDEETALTNPGRKRVPPSVWLLKVPEKPTAALVVSLEADEFALLRLSGGLGLAQTFCTSMHPEVQKMEVLMHEAAERMTKRAEARAYQEQRDSEWAQIESYANSVKVLAAVAADARARGLAMEEAAREREDAEEERFEAWVAQTEEQAYNSDEEALDKAIVQAAEAYKRTQKAVETGATCLFQAPMALEELRHVSDLSNVVFVDCRPARNVVSLTQQAKLAKEARTTLVEFYEAQAEAEAQREAYEAELKRKSKEQQNENKPSKRKSIVAEGAHTEARAITEISIEDRLAFEKAGRQAALMSGAVPIWVDIPCFWSVKRYVEARSKTPAELRGKLIVALDCDGRTASSFMANQARYHPRLARRTHMMVISEPIAKWFMNPDGRYIKWIREQPKLATELALWFQRAKAQQNADDTRAELKVIIDAASEASAN